MDLSIVTCRGFALPVEKVINLFNLFYKQKAIEESESEWAQNQKLVEVSKIKGIRAAVSTTLF